MDTRASWAIRAINVLSPLRFKVQTGRRVNQPDRLIIDLLRKKLEILNWI